jgi:aryl-alcohol dehydrogenase-like predicted oxidoreductase
VTERPLYRGGPRVSALGLGLAALGRPGYINLGHARDLGDTDPAAMQAHAHAVLDRAWERGITYVDAARSYGRAEEFLSTWLASRGHRPVVGSKWGYTYTAGWQVQAEKHEVKDHTLPVLERQIGESRALLGDRLALYQIHSATLESGVLEDRAVLDALARLRDSGLAVGLTLSGTGQSDTLIRALAIERAGQPLFATVQATWNLLEPSAGPVLAVARARGVTVIVKEALANGRLTRRNIDPRHAERIRHLTDRANRAGTTIEALSLAAALRQPWATVVLSGAAAPEHVDAACDALAVTDVGGLTALAQKPAEYWAERSAMAWN